MNWSWYKIWIGNVILLKTLLKVGIKTNDWKFLSSIQEYEVLRNFLSFAHRHLSKNKEQKTNPRFENRGIYWLKPRWFLQRNWQRKQSSIQHIFKTSTGLPWVIFSHLSEFIAMWTFLSKAGHQFLPFSFIPMGMSYLDREFLSKLHVDYEDSKNLIEDIAIVHCELIHIHPFREGNGRTARIFADLMTNRAEYPSLKLNKFREDNYPQYIHALM